METGPSLGTRDEVARNQLLRAVLVAEERATAQHEEHFFGSVRRHDLEDVSGNLPNAPVWMVTYDHANGVLYAGTNDGVYYHYVDTAGTSWQAQVLIDFADALK